MLATLRINLVRMVVNIAIVTVTRALAIFLVHFFLSLRNALLRTTFHRATTIQRFLVICRNLLKHVPLLNLRLHSILMTFVRNALNVQVERFVTCLDRLFQLLLNNLIDLWRLYQLNTLANILVRRLRLILTKVSQTLAHGVTGLAAPRRLEVIEHPLET